MTNFHNYSRFNVPEGFIAQNFSLMSETTCLEFRSIYFWGRFGAWKYEVGNMDHSFMQGVELVDRLLSGKSELTINGLAK